MFERIHNSGVIFKGIPIKDNPEFQEMDRLYHLSIELQKQGDPEGSTEAYLKALDIQAKLPSIDLQKLSQQETHLFPSVPFIDYYLSLKILRYLPLKQLVCNVAPVCRTWKSLAFDGALWREQYNLRWPLGASWEANIASIPAASANSGGGSCANKKKDESSSSEEDDNDDDDDDNVENHCKDWYSCFKNRYIANTNFQVRC